ncbi:ctsd [Symbiodinium sp. CCMP2592]|nr:ctsd [Symbiodinium sp. CCMP2592]
MVGDDSNICVPAFMKLDVKKQYGPALILGEVFMRHFFTVFSRGSGNLSEARVGFAKAKAGATPKVPVMRRSPSI